MNEKHERIFNENLIYCFVHLSNVDALPKFFLIPSKEVAEYVKWQHEFWLERSNGKDTAMRQLRINTTDPDSYSNNWTLFK